MVNFEFEDREQAQAVPGIPSPLLGCGQGEGIAAGGELGIVPRRRIDEPAPAGSVVVEVEVGCSGVFFARSNN
jgi:hypothetical protein